MSWQRDRGRLLVGALAQAHAVAAAHRLLHVVRGAVQVGLQHDADVVVALAQLLEDLERVAAVSFEPSMSRRTKPPTSLATSRIPPTFSRQRSREISRPIDDSLIEMFRSTPAGMRRSSSLLALGRALRGLAVEDVLAQLVEGGLDALAPGAARPPRTASCGRSPATKRRARKVRAFIASSRAALRGAS